MDQPEKCESCGEGDATIHLVAFAKDGRTQLDSMWICVGCTDDDVIELLPGCKDDGE